MNEISGNERWREDAWRIRPSREGRERFCSAAKDPALEDELRLERRLTAALEQLPNAPVSSNFTGRVLQEALRSEPAAARDRRRFVFQWLPRLAFGCVLVAAGFFSWQRIEMSRQAELARSVAAISTVAAPGPEILKDFEAIRALSSSPGADEQLLAALQ